MKTITRVSPLILWSLVVLLVASPAVAQFGDIGGIIKDKAEEEIKKTVKGDEEADDDSSSADSPAGGGKVVFSKSPIDPANPTDLTTSFKAGDTIYGLVQLDKSFKELSKDTEGKKATKVMFEVKVFEGDAYKTNYNVTVKNEAFESKTLLLDVAPAPDKMTAFSDPNVVIGKSFNVKDGPIRLTEYLSELEGGKHSVKIQLYKYKIWAEGTFTIEGDDFSVYEGMREKLLAEDTKSVTMPQPKMVDKDLEAEMIAALKATNAEPWNLEILRLVIIDPDWHIVRHDISGAILHRYIRANVVIKDADGVCWLYDLVTFKQEYVGDKFQPTKYGGVGDRKEIPEASVNK